MKHSAPILILFFLCGPFLPALPFSPGSMLAGSDTRPVWLRVGTSNDLFGGEYPINRDDGRSYGVNAALALGPGSGLRNGWALALDWYGYTDRAQQLRADELTLLLSWARSFFGALPLAAGESAKVSPRLFLAPGIGFRLAGDMGGQSIQNLMHDVFNLAHADFVYDSESDGSTLFPELVADLRLEGDLALALPRGTFITPGISLEGEYSIPAGPRWRADATLGLEHPSGDSFAVYAGWTSDLQDRGGTCIDLALAKEAGFHIGTRLRTGFILWEATSFLDGGFSNGSISLLFNRPLGPQAGEPTGAEASNPEAASAPSTTSAPTAGTAQSTGAHAATNRATSNDIPLLFEYSLDFIAWVRQIRLLVPLAGTSSNTIALRASFDYSYGDANTDYASPVRRNRMFQGAPGIEAVCRIPLADKAFEIAAGLDLGVRVEQDWILPDSITQATSALVQGHLALRSHTIRPFPASGLFASTQRYGISAVYSFQYLPAPELRNQLQHRLALGLLVSIDNAR